MSHLISCKSSKFRRTIGFLSQLFAIFVAKIQLEEYGNNKKDDGECQWAEKRQHNEEKDIGSKRKRHETGQTSLRISVPDKQTVRNLLDIVGKLFG